MLPILNMFQNVRHPVSYKAIQETDANYTATSLDGRVYLVSLHSENDLSNNE